MTDTPDTHSLIDKLTIAADMPTQLAEGLPALMSGWMSDKDLMHAHGLSRVFGVAGGPYKLSVQGRVPLPDSETGWSDRAGFVLQAGPKAAGVAPARLDINPQCLNPLGIGHIRATLELIGIQWHWVQHGRVTRADCTFDLYGFTPDEFVWDNPQRRKRGLWLDGDRLLTLYLGSKHSDHVCIYDKGREQMKGQDVGHTRLEFRMLKLGSVQSLPNIASPWQTYWSSILRRSRPSFRRCGWR